MEKKGENYLKSNYPIENAKIAGIQAYYMGREEGFSDLYLEKSNHCVRYTEKFMNYANTGDELFDTLRQTQKVFAGSYLDKMKKLFTALVNEIYEATQYKTNVDVWDRDCQFRAFIGYENEGQMEYIVTANYIVTPAVLAILKEVASHTNKREYGEYWNIFDLADLRYSEPGRDDIVKNDLEDWDSGWDDLEESEEDEENWEEDEEFEDDEEDS